MATKRTHRTLKQGGGTPLNARTTLKRQQLATRQPAPAQTETSVASNPKNEDTKVDTSKPLPGFKVKALESCQYGLMRRREGDVFMLKDGRDFRPRYMERVDRRTEEHTTGPQAALNKHHDEVLAGRIADRNVDPGGGGNLRARRGDDVIG